MRKEIKKGLQDYNTDGMSETIVLCEMIAVAYFISSWVSSSWWPGGEWWIGGIVFLIQILLLMIPLVNTLFIIVFTIGCGIGGWFIGETQFDNTGASVIIGLVGLLLGFMFNRDGCPSYNLSNYKEIIRVIFK